MSEMNPSTQARTDDCDDQPGLGRRDYMKLGSALAAGVGIGGLATGRASAHHGQLDDPAPADLEVGGGATYDRKISRRSADFVVDTKNGLLDALDTAGSGDVVYVADSAKIDLTGVSNVGLSGGVTLASGRGSGSMGALLYTNDYPSPLFKVYGGRVRFTGLRIRGPRWEYFETTNHDYYGATGIWLLGDDGEVDNCQFYGWTQAAVSVGARNRAVSAHVHHNSIHNNQMEGLGYGVNLYNGHSLVEHNYFDHNRHSVDGFGYETNGYEARYNLVGPNAVSHAFDMHNLSENGGDGGNRAGGTIKIHHNTFEFTHDKLGRGQEAITIRGVPADGAYFEKNWFAHPEKPNGTNVSAQGQAYRQNNLDSDNWRNIWAAGNAFGAAKPASDVGCPRSRRWRPATAVAASAQHRRADVSFQYPNSFDQQLTITDLTITPRSDAVAHLADGSMGEGRWESEIHVDADVQDGCTDIGGGLALPGTVDLDSDGHSSSPDTEPVLSADSTASVALWQFQRRNGKPKDMVDERVDVELSYRLADGETGTATFTLVPSS